MENNSMLTVKEMAEYLSVSESSIRKAVREDKIPHFRVLSRILFNKEYVDEWIKKQAS